MNKSITYNVMPSLRIFTSAFIIIRLHCMHTMHTCGLLLPMSHVACSVCLCVVHMDVLCKNGWSSWDAIWGLTYVGRLKRVLDGGWDLHGKGLSVVVRPIEKHWESLLRYMQHKRLFSPQYQLLQPTGLPPTGLLSHYIVPHAKSVALILW